MVDCKTLMCYNQVASHSPFQLTRLCTSTTIIGLLLQSWIVISFIIQIAKVNQQSGTNDCGAFAAAYCTSLAFGQDPSFVVYNQDHLRHRLLTCLESQKMSPFPIFRCRRTASTFISVKVYCNCRCPDTGELMVACDKWKNWFHAQCTQACLKDVKGKKLSTQKWYCLNCARWTKHACTS